MMSPRLQCDHLESPFSNAVLSPQNIHVTLLTSPFYVQVPGKCLHSALIWASVPMWSVFWVFGWSILTIARWLVSGLMTSSYVMVMFSLLCEERYFLRAILLFLPSMFWRRKGQRYEEARVKSSLPRKEEEEKDRERQRKVGAAKKSWWREFWWRHFFYQSHPAAALTWLLRRNVIIIIYNHLSSIIFNRGI